MTQRVARPMKFAAFISIIISMAVIIGACQGAVGPAGKDGVSIMVVAWDVPANATFTDGIWRVGVEIEPGLYRAVPEGRLSCYWERLTDVSGSFDDLIANGRTDDPTQVRIMPTDFAFMSRNCGTWSKVE